MQQAGDRAKQLSIARLLGRPQFSEHSDPAVRRAAMQMQRQRACLALHASLFA